MTTIPEMKDRCIEAAETFRKMQVAVGPTKYAAYWPEMPWVWGDDKQKLHRPLKWVPTSSMIARAEQFAGWVNAGLDEEDRKTLHQWAALKTSRNATIRGYCKRIGLLEHNYRRKIDEVFERLTFTVFGNLALSCSSGVDDDAKSGENGAPSETFWRDDETFRRRKMIQGLLAKSQQRIGSKIRSNYIRDKANVC